MVNLIHNGYEFMFTLSGCLLSRHIAIVHVPTLSSKSVDVLMLLFLVVMNTHLTFISDIKITHNIRSNHKESVKYCELKTGFKIYYYLCNA